VSPGSAARWKKKRLCRTRMMQFQQTHSCFLKLSVRELYINTVSNCLFRTALPYCSGCCTSSPLALCSCGPGAERYSNYTSSHTGTQPICDYILAGSQPFGFLDDPHIFLERIS